MTVGKIECNVNGNVLGFDWSREGERGLAHLESNKSIQGQLFMMWRDQRKNPGSFL